MISAGGMDRFDSITTAHGQCAWSLAAVAVLRFLSRVALRFDCRQCNAKCYPDPYAERDVVVHRPDRRTDGDTDSDPSDPGHGDVTVPIRKQSDVPIGGCAADR